jgi:hypothetical protein
MRRITFARWVASCAVAAQALALSGCGMSPGGGGGGGGGPLPVTIASDTLPTAGADVPYTASLTTNGGTAPFTWTLDAGSSLPAGLSLSPGGTISGTTSLLGRFVFSVTVVDSAAPATTDTASCALTVSPFDASIGLLHWGDAWTTESYPLTAVGSTSVSFTFVQNASGGSITNANPAAGTATYVAGSGAGTDVLRATASGGSTEDLTVVVQPHPVRNMTAKFSSSDVWHCRFDGKLDTSHLYDCDFDAALVTIGFRDATSFDAAGSTADQVARAYARKQVLRYLNAMFLNGEDGSSLPGGLEITFPFDEPTSPHVAVADGGVANPASNQFNVISMISGTTSGVVGTAWLDSTSNGSQENNTTTSQAGQLGVFIDEISGFFNSSYGNSQLPGSPVSSSDLAALKALLYGTASPGGRYNELRRIGEGFGRTVAAVTAHEVGHSLGLNHTSPSVATSIMNASASFGATQTYSFVASDVTILNGGLPGPGRGGSPQVAAQAGPDDALMGFEQVVCGSCRIAK